MQLQLDPLPQERAQRRLQPGNDRLEVQLSGSSDLPPSKGEELTRQRGGAIGRCQHLGRVTSPLVVGGEAPVQEFGEADDRHQHVVEVVRHTSRQPSQRFETLRLPENLLAPLLLRHVGDGAQHPQRHSVGAAHDQSPIIHQRVIACATPKAVLALPA